MVEQAGYLERFVRCRAAMLAAMAVVLAGWAVLLIAGVSRFISLSSVVSFPLWCAIAVIYALDRKTRGAVLYAGALGSWAFFLAHDVPLLMMDAGYLTPAVRIGMLVATGLIAGLANGRRCAGIAALAGLFLSCLWIAHLVVTEPVTYSLAYRAQEFFLRSLPMIVLGGLLAEVVLCVVSRKAARSGSHAVLWALIIGLTLPQLTSILLSKCAPAVQLSVRGGSAPRAALPIR